MRASLLLLSFMISNQALAFGVDLSQRLEKLLKDPKVAAHLANAGGVLEVVSFESGLIIRYGNKNQECVGKIVVEPDSGKDQFLADANCSSSVALAESVQSENALALAEDVRKLKGAIRYVRNISTVSPPVYEVVAARKEGRGLVLGYRTAEFTSNLCWVALQPTGYKNPNFFWRPSSPVACDRE